MIDEQTLIELSGRFRDSRQLERDYLLTLLLDEICSVFSNELVFKGGTALKYFYGLNRFSEDLDFSYIGTNDTSSRKSINDRISIALKRLEMQYEVVSQGHRAKKENGTVLGVNYIIRVAGPLNKAIGQLQNISIDISLRNDTIEKPVLKYISPIYPDITTFSVPTMTAEEILAEKIAAIIERDKMRDIYDAYYLVEIRKRKYDKKLLLKKLAKRNEEFDERIIKEKISSALNKMEWKSELSYLVKELPNNADVVSRLNVALGLK
jgi:hypothetical protein